MGCLLESSINVMSMQHINGALRKVFANNSRIDAFELKNGTFRFKENIQNPFKIKVPNIKKIDKGLFPK